MRESSCILLEFYIKPQLMRIWKISVMGCILLEFYIKPQQAMTDVDVAHGCILLEFYIKPQPQKLVTTPIVVVYY